MFLDQTRRKRNTEIQLPRELPDTAGVTLTEALEDREEALRLNPSLEDYFLSKVRDKKGSVVL